MYKLIGQSLNRGSRIDAESLALNLMERKSTATLSLGPEAPGVTVGEWMIDDTEPGAGIVWRVKAVDETFNTRTRAVTLEHVINTLRDASIFGEHKTETIAGDEKAKTVGARQAIEYAMGFQSIWTLGEFEFSASAAYSFNGEDVFTAIEKVCSTLDNPWWDYDLTRLPFRLNIRHRSSAKACEMRMGRNIATLRKTVDRSQMYTRIYPIGKKNLHIAGDYISKNESIWGRKDKVETDQSQETEEALRSWAQDRLNRHCEPLVTITIGGLELSRATGESLDHLVLGTVCQVPLPEFKTVITERITKLAWSDKIKEPESVTVTLCNVQQDLASIISQQASNNGGGARAAAKEAQEDHAWFVDTESHVAMVAEAIIGQGPDGVDWSRVAQIVVDGEGIHMRVVRAEGSLVTMSGRIEMNEESLTSLYEKTGIDGLEEGDTLYSKIVQTADSISTEVVRATEAEGSLSTRITQTAESITSEVQRATEAEGTLSSRIAQTAESITAEVTRATEAEGTLSSRITQTAESITSEVQRATEAEGTLSSRIAQTAESITAEVTRATEAEGTLSGRISATAESLTSVYSKTGINNLGQNETLYSKISQNAQEITTKVSAGDIASTINQTAQSVRISASKINLDGYVTASQLDAEKARFDNLVSGETGAETLVATNFYATYFYVGGRMGTWQLPDMGDASVDGSVLSASQLKLDHYHNITITESSGTVTVKIGKARSTEGAANFNIADTTFYKNAVSAARADGIATGETHIGTLRLNGNGTVANFSAELLKYGSTTEIEKNVYGYLYLNSSTYTRNTKAAVGRSNGSDMVASLPLTGYWDAALGAGKSAMGVAVNGDTGKVYVSETSAKSVSITAKAGIIYNSSTHTYTATGSAFADGIPMESKTAPSGTEAYEAGLADGASGSKKVTGAWVVLDQTGSYIFKSSGAKEWSSTTVRIYYDDGTYQDVSTTQNTLATVPYNLAYADGAASGGGTEINLTSSWSGSGNAQTYTLSGNGVKTKSMSLTYSESEWSNNQKTITVTSNDKPGDNRVFQHTITAPSSPSGGKTATRTYVSWRSGSSLYYDGSVWSRAADADVVFSDGTTQTGVDVWGAINVTPIVNAVSVSRGSWSGGSVTLRPYAAGGYGSGGSYTISLDRSVTWSGNTATIKIYESQGSGRVDTGYTFDITASGGGGDHNILIGASSRYDSRPSGYTEIFADAGAYMDLHGARAGYYTLKVTCGTASKWYYFRVGNP